MFQDINREINEVLSIIKCFFLVVDILTESLILRKPKMVNVFNDCISYHTQGKVSESGRHGGQEKERNGERRKHQRSVGVRITQ